MAGACVVGTLVCWHADTSNVGVASVGMTSDVAVRISSTNACLSRMVGRSADPTTLWAVTGICGLAAGVRLDIGTCILQQPVRLSADGGQ